MQANPLCIHYNLYNSNFVMKNYLNSLPPALPNDMLRLRTRNMPLSSNSLFAHDYPSNTKYPLCNAANFDEVHLLLTCKQLSEHRRKPFPQKIRQGSHVFMLRFINKKENLLKIAIYMKGIYNALLHISVLNSQ